MAKRVEIEEPVNVPSQCFYTFLIVGEYPLSKLSKTLITRHSQVGTDDIQGEDLDWRVGDRDRGR